MSQCQSSTLSADAAARTDENQALLQERAQRVKEELAESELRFRTLLESIPHHVWSVRRDGSLGYWNQQLVQYTGLTEAELRQGGWQALHPDDLERARAAWRTALENGTGYELEQRVRGVDGNYRRFMCRAVVLKDRQGLPVEWFGTSTDIEERMQAQSALLKLQTELAHVARAATLGELAASIAHEVNQPLTAVITNGHACMRWLGQKPPELYEAAAAVARIVRDAKRASEVIARTRAFLQRGARQLAPTNINEAISEMIAMVQAEIRSRDVTLRMPPTGVLPPVIADRIQLQQVILNLVMNALDAMSAVRDRARILQIEVHHEDAKTLRVAVCDSGIGLDCEQRERIFDAFYTAKRHGIGLGLAISRSIIEAHGGNLWSTPNDSHGETFHFTLPIAGA